MERMSPLVDIECNLRKERLGCGDLVGLAIDCLSLAGEGVFEFRGAPPATLLLAEEDSGERNCLADCVPALTGDYCSFFCLCLPSSAATAKFENSTRLTTAPLEDIADFFIPEVVAAAPP